MASSKVMPSSSSTSTSTISDLSNYPLNHSSFNPNFHHYPLHNHTYNPNYNLNSSQMISDFPNSATDDAIPPPISVDAMFSTHNGNANDGRNCDLLDAEINMIDAAGAISAVECSGGEKARRKTVDEVWREIVAGKTSSSSSGGGGGERKECKVETTDEMITLEDFLARATAGDDDDEVEDVKLEVSPSQQPQMVAVGGGDGGGGMYGFVQGMVKAAQFNPQPMAVGTGFGNGGGRGKRRGGMMMEPLDKAAQQRQRRMIKNRESAARSRERKQAYQVELESLVVKLEEENEQLLKEKVERKKERYKQLMEKVVPVLEKRRPPRKLRKVNSM